MFRPTYFLSVISCCVGMYIVVLLWNGHRSYRVKSPDVVESNNISFSGSSYPRTFTNSTHGREHLVPNIVHYIWYSKKPTPFKFHHMLSILSVQKNIKPDKIYFHTNRAPTGDYWDEVKGIPEMRIIQRKPSQNIFGERLKEPHFETSQSNVDRLVVLHETGGIYMDLDVIAIQPFDELRKYPCTVGLEADEQACGGTIICHKDAFFLVLWMNAFLDDYRSSVWAYNTGVVPYKLWKRFPHLVHIEKDRLQRPAYYELNEIYGNNIIQWTEKYSIHLWYRVWRRSKLFSEEPNRQNIKTWNSTFGQIARSVLYGTDDIIVE